MLAAVLLLILFLFAAPLLNVVIIEPCKKDGSSFKSDKEDVVFSGLTADGYTDAFVISYTHSVNKGRVKDYYRVIKNGFSYILEMYKTQFFSYGAGIPEPEGNEVFTITDEFIQISGMERKMDSLVMAVGVIAEHSIEFKSTVCNLKTYFDPQERIKISYKKISLIRYINCFVRQRVIKIYNR